MKIAYVIGKCCPGGIVAYSSAYASYLQSQGHLVHFYIDANSPAEWEGLLPGNASNISVIPSIGTSPFRNYSALVESFRIERYDVVHGMLNTLNPLSMLAAKKAHIPVRLAENLSTGSKHEAKTAIKALLKPFARVGSTSIASNSILAGEWLYGKNQMEHCFVIPNPIDVSVFHFDASKRTSFRQEYGLGDGLVIGCVARFEQQKNPLFLIDVFRSVVENEPDTQLVLVGHGSLQQSIEQRIRDYSLETNVSFLPPDTERAQFYNALDVFVLPSLYEGMPIVALEAQATGLPCLLSSEITDECALTDTCRFMNLSAPLESWAKEILALRKSNSREMNSRIVENSRFESNRAGRQLIGIYEELVAYSTERHLADGRDRQ